jgi:hypothetical protein
VERGQSLNEAGILDLRAFRFSSSQEHNVKQWIYLAEGGTWTIKRNSAWKPFSRWG